MGRNRRQGQKKLRLQKETLRNLRPVQGDQLDGVGGGLGGTTLGTIVDSLGCGFDFTWRTRGCTPPP